MKFFFFEGTISFKEIPFLETNLIFLITQNTTLHLPPTPNKGI
jgi:hypothetical protein